MKSRRVREAESGPAAELASRIQGFVPVLETKPGNLGANRQ